MKKTLKLNDKKFFDFLSTVSVNRNFNHIEDGISVGCNLIDVKDIYKFKTERLSQGILKKKIYYNEFDLYSGKLFKKISKNINTTLMYQIEYEEMNNEYKIPDVVYLSICVNLSSVYSDHSFLYYYELTNSNRDFSLDRFKIKDSSSLDEITNRVKINRYHYYKKGKEKIWVNDSFKKLLKLIK